MPARSPQPRERLRLRLCRRSLRRWRCISTVSNWPVPATYSGMRDHRVAHDAQRRASRRFDAVERGEPRERRARPGADAVAYTGMPQPSTPSGQSPGSSSVMRAQNCENPLLRRIGHARDMSRDRRRSPCTARECRRACPSSCCRSGVGLDSRAQQRVSGRFVVRQMRAALQGRFVHPDFLQNRATRPDVERLAGVRRRHHRDLARARARSVRERRPRSRPPR